MAHERNVMRAVASCANAAVPVSLGERADERTRSRGEGESVRSFVERRISLTPRMSTCVGPLPEGEGNCDTAG